MTRCLDLAPETQAALLHAQSYARESQRYQVRTEHLLRAALGCGGAPSLLARAGVDFISLGIDLKALSGRGRAGGPLIPPLAPRTSRALNSAYEEALGMNDQLLFPEHLILGFALDSESPAGGLLLAHGGSYLNLRRVADDLRLARLFGVAL